MPKLMPYIHNGQMNNLMMFFGETAQFQQTFYSGQDYKVIVCVHEILGDDVYFEVFTADQQKIYTNKDVGSFEWEFSMAATQNLIFKVTVPDAGEESVGGLEQSGCVTVLVGFNDED